MKMICFVIVSVLAVVSANAVESRHGAWRLSVGPAWRSRVKSSISGTASVAPVAGANTVTYDKDVATHGAWSAADLASGDIVVVPDNDPLSPPGSTLYAATATRTETTDTPNSGIGALSSSDERSPLGVKASAGFDFYDDGVFSVGIDITFAAYWNMKSTANGSAGGGTRTVDTATDYYLFESGPYPPGTSFSFCYPTATPYVPYRTPTGSTTTEMPATSIRARVTSDLYQIGLGPSFSWHICEWLDAYAKAAALCNIAHMDVDVNGSSSSSTACRFGAGGEIGAVAWLIDNIGLYSEVGYEWIDEVSAKNGDAKATSDFSSLIVSAGIMVSF